MTVALAFYLYILPVLIAATVWGAIWWQEWQERRHRQLPPAE
ncbi:hypothetical protein [Xaviernesmea oryzae]|nr:hypothetical protein [Xaviernesmea oryzae]SEL54381.1 hypothetical protein SAMN04487976_109126 [Xaviernesmea oryzae]